MTRLTVNDTTFNQVVGLTLDATNNVSPRAAIGWCLLDAEQQVITCDATMVGVAVTKLIRCIQRYSNRCRQLVLTIEPVQGIINTRDLIKVLDDSLCQEINIAHQIDSQLLDPHWLEWKENWSGKIHYLSKSYTASQLATGVESIKLRRRPWVMAVCSADWTGRSLSLHDLCDGFAVKEQLINYAVQNRAVLFANDQHAFIENLPESNAVDEPITPFEIYDHSSIKSLLNYWASEYRCGCVIYANLDTLGYLLEHELVDEVVYYLTEFSGIEEDEGARYHPAQINFKGWETTSCSKAGDGCRLVLRQKSAHAVKDPNLSFN